MVDIQRIEQKKARKRYECQLCGKPILPGNQYIHETFKGDEGFRTLRRHIHCDAMLNAYNSEYNFDEYYDEWEVTETLWDELCKQICDEDQRDECDMCDLYGCQLCQEKLLQPSILGAAKESVRDNYDWEAENGTDRNRTIHITGPACGRFSTSTQGAACSTSRVIAEIMRTGGRNAAWTF